MPLAFPNFQLASSLLGILSEAKELHLFQNNFTVGPGEFNLASFEEADFEGYSPAQLDQIHWDFSVSTTTVALYTVPQVFQATAPDQDQQVYGYYITDGVEVLYAETFTGGPFHIDEVGDSITVTPRVTIVNAQVE